MGPEEVRPPDEPGTAQRIGGRTTAGNDGTTRPRRKRGPTHLDRVLRLLEDHYEVCTSHFYRSYLPRFSVQIHQLRRQGYVISKRRCDVDYHDHDGTGWLYRLEAVPG